MVENNDGQSFGRHVDSMNRIRRNFYTRNTRIEFLRKTLNELTEPLNPPSATETVVDPVEQAKNEFFQVIDKLVGASERKVPATIITKLEKAALIYGNDSIINLFPGYTPALATIVSRFEYEGLHRISQINDERLLNRIFERRPFNSSRRPVTKQIVNAFIPYARALYNQRQ